jgi:hypothetical protein
MTTTFQIELWQGWRGGGWQCAATAEHLSDAEDTVTKLIQIGAGAKNVRILVQSKDGP